MDDPHDPSGWVGGSRRWTFWAFFSSHELAQSESRDDLEKLQTVTRSGSRLQSEEKPFAGCWVVLQRENEHQRCGVCKSLLLRPCLALPDKTCLKCPSVKQAMNESEKRSYTVSGLLSISPPSTRSSKRFAIRKKTCKMRSPPTKENSRSRKPPSGRDGISPAGEASSPCPIEIPGQ